MTTFRRSTDVITKQKNKCLLQSINTNLINSASLKT